VVTLFLSAYVGSVHVVVDESLPLEEVLTALLLVYLLLSFICRVLLRLGLLLVTFLQLFDQAQNLRDSHDTGTYLLSLDLFGVEVVCFCDIKM
jgi:hypothetical protein